MEKDQISKLLEKFIEIQTKKEEIELNEREYSINKRKNNLLAIKNSYNNLMALDKDKLISLLRSFDVRGELIGNKKLVLFFIKEYSIDISYLFSYFNEITLMGNYDLDIKLMMLNFEIFMDELEEELKDKSKNKKEMKLDDLIQKVFRIAKKEMLPAIGKDKLETLCLEKSIKVFKKDKALLISEVNHLLLKSAINNKKIKVRIPIKNQIREKVFKRDLNKCKVCGSKDYLEIGHKIPVSKGGGNDEGNLLTLCKGCNSKIGVNVIIEK